MKKDKFLILLLSLIYIPDLVYAENISGKSLGLGVFKIIFYLIIFVLVIFLTIFVTRYIAGSMSSFQNNKHGKILDRIILNQNFSIYIVELYNYIYIIGENNKDIKLLDKRYLDEELKEKLVDIETGYNSKKNVNSILDLDSFIKKIRKSEDNE